jgi:large subunit ribosomal protein L4
MASLKVKSASGADAGTVDLDETIFGIEPNVRSCTRSSRAARRPPAGHARAPRPAPRWPGGGAKPWKQKGTGRARAGLHPGPAVEGRRRRPRPQAALYAQRPPRR